MVEGFECVEGGLYFVDVVFGVDGGGDVVFGEDVLDFVYFYYGDFGCCCVFV